MGLRFRLKAGVDVTKSAPMAQVILNALAKYGMFLADNGGDWYVSGAPDPRWSDDELHQIQQLRGSDFEAVDESSLMRDPNSARTTDTTSPPPPPPPTPPTPPTPPPPPTPPTPPSVVVAVEYYRAVADHYFITADPGEIAKLDSGQFAGWSRTAQIFGVYSAADYALPNHSPVCRFYGRPEAGIDSHFYSASPTECQAVIDRFASAWIKESDDVFSVTLPNPVSGDCIAGTQPLYRLYNARRDANHRYTTSLAIQAQMVAAGWIAEGYGPQSVGMCVPGN